MGNGGIERRVCRGRCWLRVEKKEERDRRKKEGGVGMREEGDEGEKERGRQLKEERSIKKRKEREVTNVQTIAGVYQRTRMGRKERREGSSFFLVFGPCCIGWNERKVIIIECQKKEQHSIHKRTHE